MELRLKEAGIDSKGVFSKYTLNTAAANRPETLADSYLEISHVRIFHDALISTHAAISASINFLIKSIPFWDTTVFLDIPVSP